jgi:hypothetical protein
MLLAFGIIIIIGLVVVGSELGKISNILREIRDGQKEQLNALVKLGDDPMEHMIEDMNNAGATLTDEMLEYRHGVLFSINSQLRGISSQLDRIADAVEPPVE